MIKNVLKCLMMVTGFATLLTASANGQNVQEKGLETCYKFVYPITLEIPEQGKKVVQSDEEFDSILDKFHESVSEEQFLNEKEEDIKDVEIMFPVRVKKVDGTTVQVKSEEQFAKLYQECYPEEEISEEIEHEPTAFYTVNYPVTLIAPNGKKTVVKSEEEEVKIMDTFLGDDEDVFNFTYEFPISVTKKDGTKVTLKSEEEWGALIGE